MMSDFLEEHEKIVYDKFLNNGYIIQKIDDMSNLDFLQNFLVKKSSEFLSSKKIIDNKSWLNNIHNLISSEQLNLFRLNLIESINHEKRFREKYYKTSKKYLDLIVGNELAMQRRVNLSIQLPNDDSSLLPVHADTWSGDSAYEAVVWIPLVDCFGTKTMYILPPHKAIDLHKNFAKFVNNSQNNIFDLIKNDVIWLEIKYGEILIFNQSLPHGNVVNDESETRWSMNCRFKGIFTPYQDKKLGEFFEPITLKPLNKLGMNYKLPHLET
tara:strand:- start:15795 stop:16601 length:807 start_codon:yes stop_codon:yes gene_type:complete